MGECYVVKSESSDKRCCFVMLVTKDKAEAKNYFTKAYMINQLCGFANKIKLVESEESSSKKIDFKKMKLLDKLYFSIALGLDNQPIFDKKQLFGGLRLGPDHFNGPRKNHEIIFLPLKDNSYYPSVKGWIQGNIDLKWDRSIEYHYDLAKKKIEDNLKGLIPQWVLDSKDGHDENHPQGLLFG